MWAQFKAYLAAGIAALIGLLGIFAFRERAKRLQTERDQAEAATEAQIKANQAINEGAKREEEIRNSDNSDMRRFTE